MKKRSIVALWFFFSVSLFCKSITIGDRVSLKLPNSVTNSEIEKSLDKAHIVSIKSEGDSKIVTFQCFELGKNQFVIQGQKVEVEVKPVLSTNQKTIINNTTYQGKNSLAVEKLQNTVPWTGILIILCVIGIGFLLYFLKKRKKIINESPYQMFLAKLMENNLDYYTLSLAFKQYLQAKYSCEILALTTAEIDSNHTLNALSFDSKDAIISSMKALDYYKYSQGHSGENLEDLKKSLENHVEALEKIGTQRGTDV